MVRNLPAVGVSVTLTDGPLWQVYNGNPLATGSDGTVLFQVSCQGGGAIPLSAAVGGAAPVALQLPDCAAPPPTTAAPTTTTTPCTTSPPRGNRGRAHDQFADRTDPVGFGLRLLTACYGPGDPTSRLAVPWPPTWTASWPPTGRPRPATGGTSTRWPRPPAPPAVRGFAAALQAPAPEWR